MIILAIIGGVVIAIVLAIGLTTVLDWILRRKKDTESDGDN